MSLINAAARLAEEAPIDNPSVPAWAFGAFGFGILAVLLIITVMLKVER
jgi:hypothetical protein